jgi:hypothetical protein
MDPFLGVRGPSNISFLTPHSRRFSNQWVAIGSAIKIYDHNIGWSDGSVEHILRLRPLGPGPVKLIDYDWRRR